MPWRSATQRGDSEWTAEAAIPLFILRGFGDLSKMRINITRNLITLTPDGIGEDIVQKRIFYSLAPVKRSFHEPGRFAFLTGLERVKIRTPFLPSILRAQVAGYTFRDDLKFYTVTGRIRNYTEVPGEVDAVVLDKPLGSIPRQIKMPMELPGKTQKDFRMVVPVNEIGKRQVCVQLRDPHTGAVLQSYSIRDTSPLYVMSRPLPDRNYYTSERRAVVLCEFGLPPQLLRRSRLVARDAEGHTLATMTELNPATLFPIRIVGFCLGTHCISIELQSREGEGLTSNTIAIVKKPLRPGREVKIDRHIRILLFNGKPFLPFGIYMNCHARTPAG